MFKKLFATRTIITMLLIALSASCFSLLFTNALQAYQNKQDSTQAASTYDFANGAVSSASYDEYLIGSLSALQNFTTSVNVNHVTFEGKTVKVNNDIECGGLTLTPIGNKSCQFQGTFQGVYFTGDTNTSHYPTIANFKITTSFNISGYKCSGFFTSLIKNAQVKNIRLYNFEISSGQIVGGIVGLTSQAPKTNTGIDHCWVENIKITSSEAQYIGGIVGVNQAQYHDMGGSSGLDITNCYLENFTKSGQTDLKYAANIGPSWGNSIQVEPDDYSEQTGRVNDTSAAYVNACLVKKGITNTSNSGYYLYKNAQRNCYNTSGLVYTGFSNAWYVNYYSDGTTMFPDYNAGYPILGGFTYWIYLSCTNGTLSETRIASTRFIDIKMDKNKLTILGKTVTVSPEEGYKFINWQQIDEASIHAVCDQISYFLKFDSISIQGQTWPANIDNVVVYENYIISANVLYYSNKLELYYKIYDKVKDDSKLVTTIKYEINNNKYSVESFGQINGVSINNYTVKGLINKETYTISPTLKLKEYNVEFG